MILSVLLSFFNIPVPLFIPATLFTFNFFRCCLELINSIVYYRISTFSLLLRTAAAERGDALQYHEVHTRAYGMLITCCGDACPG